jgi:hypothetical protein
MKLNKNQRKFFEEALRHFGERAGDVLRRELVEFANENGLILPTSALRKYCQTETRGHYDLTKTGLTVETVIEDEAKDNENPKKEGSRLPDSFRSSPDVIVDTPVYAESEPAPKLPTRKRPDKAPVKTYPPSEKDSVFILFDEEMQYISAHKTVESAYNYCSSFFFHSHIGNMSKKEAVAQVMETGNCCLHDSNSGLNAYIIAQKLK